MPEFFTVSLLFLRLDDGTKNLITYKKNNLLPQIL